MQSSRGGRGGGSQQRKMLQLCAQVRRTLDLTLLGDTDDEVVQNMTVQSVEPTSGDRLQVIFTVHPPGTELEKADVLARLEAHRSLFVREIARSVNRRRLPELVFWVVKESEGGAGEVGVRP